MSTIGANFSEDAVANASSNSASTGVADAVNASNVPSAPSASSQSSSSSLNASPTCIILDAAYTVGDLAPDARYPHVYITTLYLNGPALTMQIGYEFGTMTPDGWQTAPYVPLQSLTLANAELVPFFITQPSSAVTPLWDQVERLMYKQVQARNSRTAGTIVTLGAS